MPATPSFGPTSRFKLGKVIEMNDRRGVVVGVCTASRTFQTFPVVYTRFSQAVQFVPTERKVLSFVLAQAAPGSFARSAMPRNSEANGSFGANA